MEDSDDELPMISLSQDASGSEVVMPPAGEVAAARARQRHMEDELRRLSALDAAAPRAESSGSEGEAALAAAVRALRVLPPAPPRRGAPPAAAPPARAAAARLLARLPPPAAAAAAPLRAALDADLDSHTLNRLTDKLVGALIAARPERGEWDEEEGLSVAGLLCAACLLRGGGAGAGAGAGAGRARGAWRGALGGGARGGGARGGAARRLDALLARAVAGLCAEDAAATLQALSDALRAGPPPARDLAGCLLRRAVWALLQPAPGDTQSSPPTVAELISLAERGPPLPPARRLRALRLAARLAGAGAAEGAGGGAARLVAALQPPAAERHHRDYHKMAAAAGSLRLLLRARREVAT